MSDEGPHAADIPTLPEQPVDNELAVGQVYDLHADLSGYQAEVVDLADPATVRVKWHHASNGAIDGLEQALARSILVNPATATLAVTETEPA